MNIFNLYIYVLSNPGCCDVLHETRLIRDLLKNYDPDARPVRNQSDSVRVELQMIYKELKEIVRKIKTFFWNIKSDLLLIILYFK
jgi:hypothetical protein